MRTYPTIILLPALLCCTPLHGQPDPRAKPAPAAVTPPAKESFHIYLLMGQSNMVGRDTSTLKSQVDNPRVLALNADGQWVIAKDPIHAQVGRIAPGAGPGIPFAREMLKADPKITIGLVPCAVGGTPLRRWIKGADLYEQAVSRARRAAQAGVLKGVLWHQGESDTENKQNAETYEARLTQMFKDLRGDLGLPALPIVVGQLGDFLAPEKYPYVETVRGAIQHIPVVVPGVGYASAAGLGHKGDNLHFSADAEKKLGARYAGALQKLQNAQTAGPAAAAATVAVWPEGKMPGRGAREPEGDLPPRGDNTRRITNVSRPTLTVFPAPKKDAPAPAMIVCPGGGYSYVVYNKEGAEIAQWLNAAGITALVLKYRVPNNRAAAFLDVQRALRLARSRAGEWNIDPNRLGIIGFSAGGHLAARASTQFNQQAYPAIDAIDRLSCRPDFAVLVYPAYLGREGKPAPELDLTANIPPTLILHSEDDRNYVPGSKIYHAALEAAKVAHEFKLYPTGGHGYGLRSDRDARAWPEYALEWLHRIGKGAP